MLKEVVLFIAIASCHKGFLKDGVKTVQCYSFAGIFSEGNPIDGGITDTQKKL